MSIFLSWIKCFIKQNRNIELWTTLILDWRQQESFNLDNSIKTPKGAVLRTLAKKASKIDERPGTRGTRLLTQQNIFSILTLDCNSCRFFIKLFKSSEGCSGVRGIGRWTKFPVSLRYPGSDAGEYFFCVWCSGCCSCSHETWKTNWLTLCIISGPPATRSGHFRANVSWIYYLERPFWENWIIFTLWWLFGMKWAASAAWSSSQLWLVIPFFIRRRDGVLLKLLRELPSLSVPAKVVKIWEVNFNDCTRQNM